MGETTLGIKNTTWAAVELGSAGLLAAITFRSTYGAVQKAGGVVDYLTPGKNTWKSAQVYSNVLITVLLLKGAIDAAKSYDLISGIGAGHNPGRQMLNGYGQQNYF